LKPQTVTAGAAEVKNAELRDMTKRFLVGAVLTLPVFILATARLIPALARQPWAASQALRWIEFAFTMAAVWWVGRAFLRRGWHTGATRYRSLWALISLCAGAAFVFGAVAMLRPGLLPPAMRHDDKVAIYFVAAAAMVVLVLLGQVLQIRARSRSGSAIKPLRCGPKDAVDTCGYI
jgi:Cu+-exporting ATPase